MTHDGHGAGAPLDDLGSVALFRSHVAEVSRMAEKALAVCAELTRGRSEGRAEFGGIVFHSGTQVFYHADDQSVPFRTVPHFARFAPIPGPDHLLVFRPGEPVRVGRVVPRGYWEEPARPPQHPFREVLQVSEAPSLEAAAMLLGDLSDCAYVGDNPDVARRLGIALDAAPPASLVAPLDWYRAFKTSYEIACIREAARRAGQGHRAARDGVRRGASEREIHADYLAASGQLEGETPYPNIIAWDDRASVLHYQRKRDTRPEPARSFLIDAGACVHGYASDVTRSYVRPGSGLPEAYAEILRRMEAMQLELAARATAGTSFIDLHAAALREICAILCDVGVLRVAADEAWESKLALPFLPHGLGHHLGLQVHDVGGQQVTREGELRPPPEEHPYLRTTRELDVGHVVTIEPGLYFIPMLLEPFRSADAASFDWKLVDELIPCGGVRIEDDVWVTQSGPENLTRPWVPDSGEIEG